MDRRHIGANLAIDLKSGMVREYVIQTRTLPKGALYVHLLRRDSQRQSLLFAYGPFDSGLPVTTLEDAVATLWRTMVDDLTVTASGQLGLPGIHPDPDETPASPGR